MRLRDSWEGDDFIFLPNAHCIAFFFFLFDMVLLQWNIHPCPHASLEARDRQALAHRDHHHNHHHQPFT